MDHFPKPIVVVSKCLEFDACRYNGARLTDTLVQMLTPYVQFKPVCPEVEIGLGTPRPIIQLVRKGKTTIRLIQPDTGRDLTADMEKFSKDHLDQIGEVDGFILKKKSPSCGIKTAKLFMPGSKQAVAYSETGVFARHVLERFPGLAIEDEGRLNDIQIRHHWLTRLFTLAVFRHLKKRPTARGLVAFHSRYKFVLMAYNQTKMRKMGKVVANLKAQPLTELYEEYHRLLMESLSRQAAIKANVNVLMHALGYFKDHLTGKEKQLFLDTLESYRERLVPLSTVNAILNTWGARYDKPYIAEQAFFAPYPHALTQIPVM